MDECSFEKKNYKRRNLNILNNNNWGQSYQK
jgi:hypothetical protein